MYFTPLIPSLDKYYETEFPNLLEVTVGISKKIKDNLYIKEIGTILVPKEIVIEAESRSLAVEEFDEQTDELCDYIWLNLSKINWFIDSMEHDS